MTTATTSVPVKTLHQTANTEFKAGYKKTVRNAVYGAVLLHIAAFVFSPPFTFEPYKLKEEKFEVVEVPDDIVIPPPPQDIPQPTVPVAAADDEATEEEVAPTTFDSFEELPPPPPPSGGGGDVFLAFDEPPQLIEFVPPEYPPLAREAGIEGVVLVKVLVNEQGKVLDASVLSSDVTPQMEQEAVKAAMKCRFRPAKQRTIAVKAQVAIPFGFRLN